MLKEHTLEKQNMQKWKIICNCNLKVKVSAKSVYVRYKSFIHFCLCEEVLKFSQMWNDWQYVV